MFYPTIYRRRITDITAADLKAMGIKGLLLDIDNTLTTHDNPDLAPAVTAWLSAMQEAGFGMMLVSNNSAERVAPFAEKIGLPYQAKAAKPLPKGYRLAADAMGLPLTQCVAIGDQIFTDIWGANMAHMASVLLEPIEPETAQKFILFKRKLEKIVLACPREKKRREEQYYAK